MKKIVFKKINEKLHGSTGLRVDAKIFKSFFAIVFDLNLIKTFGKIELVSQFGNTSLGSLWQPLTLGVTLFGIGVIFGSLFNLDVNSYVPYLAVGMILWTFIVGALNESTRLFINTANINLPYDKYIIMPVQIFARNISMLILNIPTLLVVFYLCGVETTIYNVSLSILALTTTLIVVFSTTLVFSIIGSRFRDFPNIVQNGLQILFFVTPIMWQIDGVKYQNYLALNPLHQMISLVRSPLLHTTAANFTSLALFFIMSLGFFACCALFWCIFSWRVPYHAR